MSTENKTTMTDDEYRLHAGRAEALALTAPTTDRAEYWAGYRKGLLLAWGGPDVRLGGDPAYTARTIASPAPVGEGCRAALRDHAPHLLPQPTNDPDPMPDPIRDPRTLYGHEPLDLEGLPVLDRPYPGELPADLAPWHVYLADAGHSVLVVRHEDVSDPFGRVLYQADPPVLDSDVDGLLLPVPVRTALRLRYEMHPAGSRGLVPVVAGLDYSRDVGLVVPAEDEEF